MRMADSSPRKLSFIAARRSGSRILSGTGGARRNRRLTQTQQPLMKSGRFMVHGSGMSSEFRLQRKGYPVAALLAVMFVGPLSPFFALILLGAREHMAEERVENFAQLSRQSTVLAQALDRELSVSLKAAK